MGLPNGVHHLAICTKNIKEQIEYFTEVVGCELVALYWMHGVDNTFHGFLRLSDSSSIAFVQSPEVAKIAPIKGVSHAGQHRGQRCAGRDAASRAQRRYRGGPARDSRPRARARPLDNGADRPRLLQIDLPRGARGHHARVLDLRGLGDRRRRLGSIRKWSRWRESTLKSSNATSIRRRSRPRAERLRSRRAIRRNR